MTADAPILALPVPGLRVHASVRAPMLTSVCARIFTLPLVCTGLVALWIDCLVPRSMEDPDIWWHLRNAAIQRQAHAWLHRDLYSFTAAGASWIDHEWLAEVPFYLAWRLAGTTGLYLVTLLTIEFTLLGIYRLTCMKSRGAPSSAGCILAASLAAVLATVSFGPRMLLFGWACLAIELVILEKFAALAPAATRTSTFSLILGLPLLFCIWINLHGSWLIGLVLFAVFVVCGSVRFHSGSIANPAWTRQQQRSLCVALLLSLGAIFINPYGWHLVAYPFDMAFHQRLNIASAEEWKPLDFQTARGLVLMLALGALCLIQLLKRRLWTLTELAFAAIGIYAACRHSRFLFLGGMLVMPSLGKSLSELFPSRGTPTGPDPATSNRPWIHAFLIAAIFFLGLFIAVRAPRTTPEEKFPVAALPYLQHFHPQGRLFNEYLWGGYLAYNVPGLPVFIDSRMDIFERNGALRDYLDIIYLKHSLALLDKYQVRYVLFEKDTPLVYLLQQTHAWDTDYDDGRVVLLERIRLPGHASAAPYIAAIPQ